MFICMNPGFYLSTLHLKGHFHMMSNPYLDLEAVNIKQKAL